MQSAPAAAAVAAAQEALESMRSGAPPLTPVRRTTAAEAADAPFALAFVGDEARVGWPFATSVPGVPLCAPLQHALPPDVVLAALCDEGVRADVTELATERESIAVRASLSAGDWTRMMHALPPPGGRWTALAGGAASSGGVLSGAAGGSALFPSSHATMLEPDLAPSFVLQPDDVPELAEHVASRAVHAQAEGTSRTSSSMQRAPQHLSTYASGTAGSKPFLPGGMEPRAARREGLSIAAIQELLSELAHASSLVDAPDGFDDRADATGDVVFLRPPAPEASEVVAAGAPAYPDHGPVQPPALPSTGASGTAHERVTAEALLVSDAETRGRDSEPGDAGGGVDALLRETELARGAAPGGAASQRGASALSSTATGSGGGSGVAGSAHAFQWAVVDDTDVSLFHQIVPDLAMQFSFELDVFQKRAVVHLERGENVFVAAHTSAGKTVVAEYAVALSRNHGTKVIYTSPIKALSNQKFRDFKLKFGDVGLITGDVTLNPDASCLIMTTEILRTMLYKGADIIRDVEWVIFDEVHYVNDRDRGVVWEEVIIMLPAHVSVIMLSATSPNHVEFADWTGRVRQRRVFVCSTSRRPVPLEHYLYVEGELHMVLDSSGTMLAQGLRNASLARGGAAGSSKAAQGGGGGAGGGRGPRLGPSHWSKLVEVLKKRKLLPTVVFMFSKKKCEDTLEMLSAMDLTTEREKHQTHIFIEKCLSRLKPADRMLPQVQRMRDVLKRGLGIHHGGLLPIVKEMVEILFSNGLVRLLFATETFAMGINMPARSVAFSSIRKHDGQQFRFLEPGEYIQMSGRAGRRGLDNVGYVMLLCWDDVPERTVLSHLMKGRATQLQSQFRLTYNMMLNLLRVEDVKVEDMMRRSFAEASAQRHIAQSGEELEALRRPLEPLTCILGEPEIEEYYDRCVTAQAYAERAYAFYRTSRAFQTLLVPGRVVRLMTRELPNVLGVVLKPDAGIGAGAGGGGGAAVPLASVLALRAVGSASAIKVPHTAIAVLLSAKLKGDFDGCAAGSAPSIAQMRGELEALARSKPQPAPLQISKDLRISDMDGVDVLQSLYETTSALSSCKCQTCPKLVEQYAEAERRAQRRARLAELSHLMSTDGLALAPEFSCRLEVLRELAYVDDANTVLLKGRVACELNAVDELLCSEMVFAGVFAPLTPAEAAALVSTMVFEETVDEEYAPVLTAGLVEAKEHVDKLVVQLAELQAAHGLHISVEEYAKTVNFGLAEVVHRWASGEPFVDLCRITPVLEGSIVRCMVRTDEACRELRNVGRTIGDIALQRKMEAASELIKRDIVFAASLYIS